MEDKHQLFKLYKPFGVISQFSSNDLKAVGKKKFLKDLFNFPEGIMPIGRLDEKSEGLLLLTTDGKLSDSVNRAGIEKEYWAQLDGEIPSAAISALRVGVEIGLKGKKYLTQPCSVKPLKPPEHLAPPNAKLRIGRHRPTSWISLVLTEGKYRQVRKMTAAAGYPTLRLIRVRIGKITLEGLSPGEVAVCKLPSP